MNDFLINTDQQALTAHRIDETIDTQPSIRIWLCGPLQVEWVDPDTGRGLPLTQEQLEGKDATQALALLKLLLSQPGRRAHRDWIMEQFWPEQVRSVATHRFHNITSAFRKLFSPPMVVLSCQQLVARKIAPASTVCLPTHDCGSIVMQLAGKWSKPHGWSALVMTRFHSGNGPMIYSNEGPFCPTSPMRPGGEGTTRAACWLLSPVCTCPLTPVSGPLRGNWGS